MSSSNHHPQAGQSLIELLIAMSVFVAVVASIMFLTLDAHSANRQGGERSAAALAAQAGVEAAQSITDRGWKYLTTGPHGLSSTSGQWEFTGTPDTIDTFTRVVTVAPVARNGSGDVVTSGGTVDFDTKKITTSVTWDFTPDRPSNVTFEQYRTNWRSRRFFQTTQAEFDGGTKAQVVSTATGGGELELATSGGAPYGNQFVVDTTAAALNMTNALYRTSLRFTAQSSKTVTGLRIYLQTEVGASPTYRYGLQADAAGSPSGTWLGATQNGFANHQANATGWRTITLNEPVALTAGTVYHLVVQYQSGTINGSRYVALRMSNPQNNLVPLANAVDPASTVLTSTNGGSSWTDATRQPLYVLGFNDGSYEGNPYITMTESTVFGVNFTGELFTPASDVTLTDITVSARKGAAGIPADDLDVTLYDTTTSSVMATGMLVTRAAVTAAFAPYTFAFPTAQNLVTGRTYRIYVSAPGAVNANSYRVRQLNVTNNAVYRDIGFGATAASFIRSTNSGTSWTVTPASDLGGYWFSAQSGFATSGDFISSPHDTQSDTSVLNYLAWTAAVPVGTSLQFQLRVAATQAGLASAAWIGPDGTSATFFTAAGETIPDTAARRWVQYRAYFTSTGTATPALADVTLNYE